MRTAKDSFLFEIQVLTRVNVTLFLGLICTFPCYTISKYDSGGQFLQLYYFKEL